MIRVFDSILPVDPCETHDDHGVTVESWIASRAPDYQRGGSQLVSVSINGQIIDPMAWHETVIRESDNVDIRVLPRGFVGDFFSGIAGFLINPFFSGSLFAADAALKALIDIPSLNRNAGAQGTNIEPVDARANTARLGAVIPERFGRFINYPDYLNQPRRYYVDQKTQAIDLLMCLGTGSFDIEAGSVRIGQTPVDDIGAGITYQIFEPGASVAGNQCHENWYNAPEVGGTRASAGLPLTDSKNLTQSVSSTVTSAGGDQTLDLVSAVPSDWREGVTVTADLTRSCTVVAGATTSDPLEFHGSFLDVLAEVGDLVRVGLYGGDTSRVYEVVTYNDPGGPNEYFTIKTTGPIPTLVTGDNPDGWTVGAKTIVYDRADAFYEIASINRTTNEIDFLRVISSGYDAIWNSAFGGWPAMSGSGFSVILNLAPAESAGLWSPWFAATPSGETCDSIEIDILFPSGLGFVNDSGDIEARTRTVEIAVRQAGSTSAGTIYTRTITGQTRDQIGETYRLTVSPAAGVEVRMRRTTAESDSLKDLDKIEWTALKTRLPTVTSYAGVTVLAMTIVGSDKLATQSENQVNLITTRKLEPLAGGAEVATRGIAEAAAYIARSTGYDDDQIDIAELTRLGDIWTTRGDTFDHVFGEVTSKEAIDTALRAGFAESTIDTGVIKPVRDEPRTVFEQGYSPENMTAPLRRTFEALQVDEPDGVEVEYTSADTWTKETVLCLLPGDNGFKLDKIRLDGVTDRTRAWRIGMRRRRAQRYRRWTYSFETELDALNSSYLSYVPLLDDIPGYGKVAILESISADRITVSEPLEWTAGESHVIAYRDENGDTIGPFHAAEGPDEYTVLVSIPEPWPAVLPSDQEPTHIFFGTTARWNFPALITEITPSGSLQVGVTATNYDDRVYSSDNDSPP